MANSREDSAEDGVVEAGAVGKNDMVQAADGVTGLGGEDVDGNDVAGLDGAAGPADGDHGVDRLDASLHGTLDVLALHHAGRDALDRVELVRADRAFAVDRLAERIHHPTDQLGAHRHLENAAGGLDRIAFGNVFVIAEHHRTHRVALEVQRKAEGVAGKLDHLALHHIGQAVDAADAVGHRDDRTLVARIGGNVEVLDLALEQFADLSRIQLHGLPLILQAVSALAM